MTEGRKNTSSSTRSGFIGRDGANARLNVTVAFQTPAGLKPRTPHKPVEDTVAEALEKRRKADDMRASAEAAKSKPAAPKDESAAATVRDKATDTAQEEPKVAVQAARTQEEGDAAERVRSLPKLSLRQWMLGGAAAAAVPVALLAGVALTQKEDIAAETVEAEPAVATVFKQPKQRYEVVETASGRVIEVIEEDSLQAYLRDRQQEADRLVALLRPAVMGCDSPEKYNAFWVAGLDNSPALKNFIEVYKERMGVGQPIDKNSGTRRIYNLQVAMSVSNCFASTERRNNTGSFDAETVAAIKRFQEANGLPATGAADQATVDKIVTSAAMRVTYVMHNLDIAAKEFEMDTADILQVAWHESFYSNMLDSGTGPEGVGQMTDDTFLSELANMEHPFYDEYNRGYRAGGDERRRVRTELEANKHSVELGTRAMVSHCATLVSEWNMRGCAAAYPIYQLGAGDYLALRRAARSKPNVQARRVAGGTKYNNYGNMTAARAFTHVSTMVDNSADRRVALGDFEYLRTIQTERANILRHGIPGLLPAVTLRPIAATMGT